MRRVDVPHDNHIARVIRGGFAVLYCASIRAYFRPRLVIDHDHALGSPLARPPHRGPPWRMGGWLWRVLFFGFGAFHVERAISDHGQCQSVTVVNSVQTAIYAGWAGKPLPPLSLLHKNGCASASAAFSPDDTHADAVPPGDEPGGRSLARVTATMAWSDVVHATVRDWTGAPLMPVDFERDFKRVMWKVDNNENISRWVRAGRTARERALTSANYLVPLL